MFLLLQLESSNTQFDGPLSKEKFPVLTGGKIHMFSSRWLLMKTDQRFSSADKLHTSYSTGPIVMCCVAACNCSIFVPFWGLVLGAWTPWSVEERRQREGGRGAEREEKMMVDED